MSPAQRLSYALFSLRWWASPSFRRRHFRALIRAMSGPERLTRAYLAIAGELDYSRDWLAAIAEVEQHEMAALQAEAAP